MMIRHYLFQLTGCIRRKERKKRNLLSEICCAIDRSNTGKFNLVMPNKCPRYDPIQNTWDVSGVSVGIMTFATLACINRFLVIKRYDRLRNSGSDH